MSTETAPAAGASAPAPATTPKSPIPKDMRDRILGIRPTPVDPAEVEKQEAEKKRIADEKLAADKKLADDKAAADAKAAEAKKKPKSGPALPEEKPPVGKSIEQTVREILPEITGEGKKKTTPTANPEIEREIELAKFAERKGGEKFTGFADKVADFYATQDALLADKAKELGGANSADFREYLQGDEFKGWVAQNRPNYAGQKSRLQEDMVAEKARLDAERALEPKLKELERQTLELKHGPRIEQMKDAVLQKIVLVDPSDEKDPALAGFTADPMKFGEEHPEEAQIIASEAQLILNRVDAVLRIDHDIVTPNPKNNPDHKWLADFMVDRNQELAKRHPTGLEMEDGKILIDGFTYEKKGLRNDPRYRRWTAIELAGMIAKEGNDEILKRLKTRREGVLKSIYGKPSAKEEKPPEIPPTGAAKEPEKPAASPEAPFSRGSGAARKPAAEKKTLASRYA